MQKLWFSQHQTRVNSLRTRFCRAVATKSCSACASERPGSAPGRQLGVPHGQHGAQDGQHGAQDNPTWRPVAVPSASRRVPGGTRSDPSRPRAPPNNIWSNFRRFWDRSGRLGRPFSASPAHFSNAVAIDGASLSGSLKRAVQPNRASWRVRCVVASCCARGFRNLLVRSFFDANMQAHLVFEKYEKIGSNY